MSPAAARPLTGPRFEQVLERLEVSAVCASHRAGHHRGAELREAGGLTSVSKRHAGSAGRGVGPCVGCLHREWPLRRAHHEALSRLDLADLVGVCEGAAQKARSETNLRADDEERIRLPVDRLDVLVPDGGVVGIRRVRGDLIAGPVDLDMGLDVDAHRGKRVARRREVDHAPTALDRPEEWNTIPGGGFPVGSRLRFIALSGANRRTV